MDRRRYLKYAASAFVVAGAAAAAYFFLGEKPTSGSTSSERPTTQTLEEGADVLFTGGTIHLDVNATTSALAVRGDKVIWTGKEAEGLAGPNTTRVDLKGAHVFPGFHDSHIHVLGGSFAATQLSLVGADTMAKITTKVKDYAAAYAEASWIVGFGWKLALGEDPSGIALDAVTGDRPSFLVDQSGHSAIVNSAAMARAGITDATPDPEGGKIVRDPATKKATGHLKEAAMGLVGNVMVQALTDQQVGGGLEPVLQNFAKVGLTGVSEILGLPALKTARPWLFTQLEERGRLPLRVHYYVPIFSLEDVDTAASFRGRYDTELVRFAGGKIWVDGAMGSADSWTSFPHVGDPTNFGIHYFTPEQLRAIVGRAEELHVPLQFHTNGDAAVEDALGALESAAAQQGRLNSQHCLVHMGFVTADQRQRIKQLRLICSVQPGFWSGDPAHRIAVYGPERSAEAYDYRALADAGIILAMGTDWPVSPTTDPRTVMQIGTLPPHGQSVLKMAEIIRGYTEGSALSVTRSDLGQLKVGFAADLVILDQNPLAVTNENIEKIQVLGTWVAGLPSHPGQ